MGSGGSAGRLSDPLRPSTSSIRASSLLAGVLPTVHQGSHLNPGASDSSSEGGSRTSPSVSGFLQPSIPRPEGFGVVAPHHRPLDPERLRHLVSLPHGDSTVSPSFHPSGRLDGLPGPAGRLPAGSGSSRFASLSLLRGRRKDVPVSGPLLRSDDRVPSLHEEFPPSSTSMGSGWTLHQEVVDHLVHKWPAVIDLFATSLTARLPVYFSPASDPQAAGTDALLQSWDNLQAYAFPPIAITRRVLVKLRSSKNCVNTHSSVLASRGNGSRTFWNYCPTFHHTVKSKRSKTAPLPPLPPKSAHASADCMATIKRFARQAGFSFTVAGQLVFCRRQSTRLNYQARWGTYRKWCRDFGHRSSSPSIAKIAEFLTYMFKHKGAALSTIKGYRAMLSAVFKFPLPEISTSPILKDFIRSFEISAPRPLFPPPPWDLDKVLREHLL